MIKNMEQLNKTPITGKFGDVAKVLDTNFGLIVTKLMELSKSKKMNCGFYSSETELKTAYPNPDKGMVAYVGSGTDYTVYRCKTDGTWTATSETFKVTVDLSTYATKDALAQVKGSVDNLLLGAVYGGIAARTTNPGSPKNKVFYLPTEVGEYPNFGNLSVAANEIAFLYYDGTKWTKQSVDFSNDFNDINDKLSDLSNKTKPLENISEEESEELSDSIEFTSDDSTETYAKVDSDGVHAKKFFDMDGNKMHTLKDLIVVDANGNGDYTTVVDALNNAGDSPTKRVIIYIKSGSYNMPITTPTVTPYVENKRNLVLIGEDRDKVVLRCDCGIYYYQKMYDAATLKLGGNVLIKNLTLICTKEKFSEYNIPTEIDGKDSSTLIQAYCWHADRGTDNFGTQRIENCKLINTIGSCIGFGSHAGSDIEIINCDITSTFDDKNGAKSWQSPIWGHTSGSEQEENVIIKNCIIRNKNTGRLFFCDSDLTNVKLINNIFSISGNADYIIRKISTESFGNNVSNFNINKVITI